MAQSLSVFVPVTGLPNIWCARRGGARCTAVKLKGGGLMLFSPVQGLTASVQEQLAALGSVRFLLAPNHYHNKALLEYSKAFPDAAVVAPLDAQPRLARVTGLAFDDLSALTSVLPPSVKLLFPPGLKTGECWLRIKAKDTMAWVVVDAFCTRTAPAGASKASAPELLGTFPKMGVADKSVYGEWVQKQVAKDQPTIILPCHGLEIRAVSLPKKLNALIAKL